GGRRDVVMDVDAVGRRLREHLGAEPGAERHGSGAAGDQVAPADAGRSKRLGAAGASCRHAVTNERSDHGLLLARRLWRPVGLNALREPSRAASVEVKGPGFRADRPTAGFGAPGGNGTIGGAGASPRPTA